MNKKLKPYIPAFVLVGIGALVPVAMFLASLFYFLLHKINPFKGNFSIWTWIDYFIKDPSDRLVQWKALGISLLITYLLIPFAIAMMFQRRRPSLHGEARFATPHEIRASGLLGKKGIIVGKYNDRLLYFDSQQFVALAAPTRSGKGVGIVIPNCLTFEDSLVVTDIKLEVYNLTAGYRKNVMKQDVYLFNPFAGEPADPDDTDSKPTPMATHRWNPLDVIPKGVYRVGEITSIGQVFWSGADEKNKFWDDNARDVFVGVVLMLCELRDKRKEEQAAKGKSDIPDYPVSFGEVLRQVNGRGTGKPAEAYFKEQIETYPWLSSQCRDLLLGLANQTEDVAKSVISTLKAPLGVWFNPIVDAATSVSDFKLSDVRKKRMTVYVGIQPKRLKDAARLVNLLFSQLVSLNSSELPQDNPRLKYSCLLLMDEFTAFGKIEIIATAVSFIAGYNLRLLPIFQSIQQIEGVYGKDVARNFLINHAMQIVYAPRDQEDANKVSENLGYFTLKNDSRSRSTGGKGGGGSISTSDQKRALMLPQEVKEMGMWKEIIFLENTKPIFCEKIKYFEDPFFMQRLLPTPTPPLLDVEQFVARTENRTRDLTADDIDYSELRLVDPPGVSQLQSLNDCPQLPPDWGAPPDAEAMSVSVGAMFSAVYGTPAEQFAEIAENIRTHARSRAEALEALENSPHVRTALTGHGRAVSGADLDNIFGNLGDESIDDDLMAIEADNTPLPDDTAIPMPPDEINAAFGAETRNENTPPALPEARDDNPFAALANTFGDEDEEDGNAMEFRA